MHALITLNGLPNIDKPKSIVNVSYNDEKQLIVKLKALQAGYSFDGRDKPKIKRYKVPGKNGLRSIIDCFTDADWHYVAHINVSSTSAPTENLP